MSKNDSTTCTPATSAKSRDAITREAFGVGRVIGIDAKIYLDGKYQASTFDQITLKGGAGDPALPREIQKVTRTVVADALAEAVFGDARHAG